MSLYFHPKNNNNNTGKKKKDRRWLLGVNNDLQDTQKQSSFFDLEDCKRKENARIRFFLSPECKKRKSYVSYGNT